MNADINILYRSPLFKVIDFRCKAKQGEISEMEWNSNYHINFTRRGNFGYKIGRHFYDVHSGNILLENAETEFTVSHDHHVKDECTSICLQKELIGKIKQLYTKSGLPDNLIECSMKKFKFPFVLIRSKPEFEYYHNLIYQMTTNSKINDSLKIDEFIINFLHYLFASMYETNQILSPIQLDKNIKNLHLEMIDRAKYFIFTHFQKDISLSDIAEFAYVSPFHFSRLFKQFTNSSPYQYLLEARMNHAVMLLLNTSEKITEVCFESGFNSLENFIAAFTKRYSISPLKFRHNYSQKNSKNSKVYIDLKY